MRRGMHWQCRILQQQQFEVDLGKEEEEERRILGGALARVRVKWRE